MGAMRAVGRRAGALLALALFVTAPTAQAKCKFKGVMTDEEIAACRAEERATAQPKPEAPRPGLAPALEPSAPAPSYASRAEDVEPGLQRSQGQLGQASDPAYGLSRRVEAAAPTNVVVEEVSTGADSVTVTGTGDDGPIATYLRNLNQAGMRGFLQRVRDREDGQQEFTLVVQAN